MSRLTEMFDYLKVDPDYLSERAFRYAGFDIDDECKRVRRQHLAEMRKCGIQPKITLW